MVIIYIIAVISIFLNTYLWMRIIKLKNDLSDTLSDWHQEGLRLNEEWYRKGIREGARRAYLDIRNELQIIANAAGENEKGSDI